MSLYVSKKMDILADNINVYVCAFQNVVVIRCNCAVNHILRSYIRFRLQLKSRGFFQVKFECSEKLHLLLFEV